MYSCWHSMEQNIFEKSAHNSLMNASHPSSMLQEGRLAFISENSKMIGKRPPGWSPMRWRQSWFASSTNESRTNRNDFLVQRRRHSKLTKTKKSNLVSSKWDNVGFNSVNVSSSKKITAWDNPSPPYSSVNKYRSN